MFVLPYSRYYLFWSFYFLSSIEIIAIFLHISGTTGLPKGVMLTHSNICANIQQIVHPGTARVIPTTSSRDLFYKMF